MVGLLYREEIEILFPGQLERWRKNPVGMRVPGVPSVRLCMGLYSYIGGSRNSVQMFSRKYLRWSSHEAFGQIIILRC